MEYNFDKNYKNVNEPVIDDNEEFTINLFEWAFRFLRYWYLFVIALIVALGLTYVKTRSWMPLYKTESKLIIESSSSLSSYSFMQGFNSMDYVNTNNQLLILGSYDLVNRTLQKLPFGVEFYTKDYFRKYSLYGREPITIDVQQMNDRLYGCEFRFVFVDDTNFEIVLEDEYSRELFPDFKIRGQYGVPFDSYLLSGVVNKLYLLGDYSDFLFKFRSLKSLESEFVSRLELSYIGEQSSVVSVSLVGNVAARDKDFIDALCEEFLASNLEEKNEEATRTIDFIDKQLFLILDSLQTAEGQLRQYRLDNNIFDVSAYASTVLSKLSSLDAHRSELNLKDAYFDELAKYLKESVEDESLVAPSTIGVSDPVLLDLVNQFNELQQRRSDLGEKNPNYERYSKRMEEVRLTMLEVIANVRKVYDMERAAFEKEYESVMSDLQGLPEKELAMVNFERSYKINDNYYTFLLQKQSEAQIRKASNVPDNKILQKARVNYSPVNMADKTKVYLLFVIIGLLIPVAFVVIKELLNTTIRGENDILNITKLPILGTIRHTDSQNNKIQSVQNSRSLFAEGFRVIRSRIEFLVQRKTNVSILVTSAESGDGKTHFVANLAGIYSLISDKVILVDVDIRNPKLSEKLGYKEAKGLVHVLIGQATLDEVIVKDDAELGFHFLPAGVVPPNPAELIGSEAMSKLLLELAQIYDYRIFDTSPLGLVADAYPLARNVDVNLLIARAFKSDKGFFKNFIEQIQQDNIDNVYVVLNDLKVPKVGKYGKYGHYGKYGYGKYSYGNSYYYHKQSSKYYHDEEK
jgi:capsular exopolysaccharide synthesis family protein